MVNKLIIGLHGAKYAGKDTAALGLIEQRGFGRVVLAGPLKRMVEVYLSSTVGVEETVIKMMDKFFEEQGVAGYTRSQLLSPDGRQMPTSYLNGHKTNYAINELHAWGATHIGGPFWRGEGEGPGISDGKMPCYIEGALKETPVSVLNGKTARHIMQTLGTEWGRQRLGQSLWTDVALRRAETMPLCVITDVRFDNEAQAVASAGGVVIKILREGMGPSGDAHASEAGVSAHLIHDTVYNNGSVVDLQSRLIKKADAILLSGRRGRGPDLP